VRLTLSRRRALLAWAEAHDAFVIEDDYDGEFRFDGPPLPPLASLPGAERVAYVGTFSKVLAPSLRLGYVISPQLSHPLAMRKAELNYQVCAVSQLALSRFIDDLHLDRHVARVRRVYAARRAALLDALRDVWRDRPVMGLEAGLHACLPLKHGENAEAIVQACFERQVAVADASVYALRGPYAPALVLGYAAYPTETLRAAARVLASVMRGSS
jgi:GntR family transcriptional regulator / MocR family aminotransferase